MPDNSVKYVCRQGPTTTVSSGASKENTQFKSAAVFKLIEDYIKKNGPELVKTTQGVFCFKIKQGDDEMVWVVDLKSGAGSVKQDPNGTGNVIFSANDEDILKVLLGQIGAQQAFFQGKLKIKGNLGLAMKLQPVLSKVKLSKL